MDVLKQRLSEAGLHAMRLRAGEPRRLVEIQVMPIGVEVCVTGRRENKALIGWENIEVAKTNIIIEQIDEMLNQISIPDTIHNHGNRPPYWR